METSDLECGGRIRVFPLGASGVERADETTGEVTGTATMKGFQERVHALGECPCLRAVEEDRLNDGLVKIAHNAGGYSRFAKDTGDPTPLLPSLL